MRNLAPSNSVFCTKNQAKAYLFLFCVILQISPTVLGMSPSYYVKDTGESLKVSLRSIDLKEVVMSCFPVQTV